MSCKPEISILVPCCNVERFVGECLTSIKRQTFTNIEVICLNDGSTDGTLAEIKKVADGDERFVVIDKPNTGYGATMNFGLSLARGAFIGIVESDDYIEPNMYKLLHEEICAKNLDYVRCCYFRFEGGVDYKESCSVLPKNQIFKPICRQEVFKQPPSIWAALYRRDFLKDNGINFLETPGAAFQDTSFAFKVALAAERVLCVEDFLLHYRIHGNNSVKKKNNSDVIFREFDESYRWACERGFFAEISKIFLELEYGVFKWNYYRLATDEANKFLVEWGNRWRRCKGYGVGLSNFRLYTKYLRVVLVPWFMRLYLRCRR